MEYLRDILRDTIKKNRDETYDKIINRIISEIKTLVENKVILDERFNLTIKDIKPDLAHVNNSQIEEIEKIIYDKYRINTKIYKNFYAPAPKNNNLWLEVTVNLKEERR